MPADFKLWNDLNDTESEWISWPDAPRSPYPSLCIGKWIWKERAAEDTRLLFRKEFRIENNSGIRAAYINTQIPPCTGIACTCYLNGRQAANHLVRGIKQDVDVTLLLRPGLNTVTAVSSSRDGMPGMAFGMRIEYWNGETQEILSDESWEVTDSMENSERAKHVPCITGVLEQTVISDNTDPVLEQGEGAFPSLLFRKEFECGEQPEKAELYVCGLGYSVSWINGIRIGDAVLDPGQTEYEKFGLYRHFDITDTVTPGVNTVGVMLGDGWYNQDRVWGGMSYGLPGVKALVVVTYPDKEKRIVTDSTWSVSTGPILSNNVYGGEHYDARLEKSGWSKTGYDDSTWESAVTVDPLTPELRPQLIPPVRKIRELNPVSVTLSGPGRWLFDFGQNMAGWARLKIAAETGTEIRLRFAECLTPDGRLDPVSTGVWATHVYQGDTYICKGEGVEVWEPEFTYHGFRYAEVEGVKQEPSPDLLTAVMVHTDVQQRGEFESSDEGLNTLHEMMDWTFLSNLHSIPTDCPAREKCGWLGDAHVVAETALYNYDMKEFNRKYTDDMIASTAYREDKLPSIIAPGKRGRGGTNTDWLCALILVPWYSYVYTGDRSILETAYTHMKNLVTVTDQEFPSGLVTDGFGDWCPPGGNNAKTKPVRECTTTAAFYHSVRCMIKIAEILDKEDDARKFTEIARKVRRAFNSEFLNDGSYGTQGGDGMALYYDIVPEDIQGAVIEDLIEKIHEHDHHLMTGILSHFPVLWSLTASGNAELALKALTQKTFPSFLRMHEIGATTLLECFDDPDEDGYLSPNSHNHPMQGGYDAWLYGAVGGITPDPENPGFKNTIFRLWCAPYLESGKASVRTEKGIVSSEWTQKDGEVKWTVQIPEGCTGMVWTTNPERDWICREIGPADHTFKYTV